MKVKEVIQALSEFNQEAQLQIVIKQYNKRYGLALNIEYGAHDWQYLTMAINGRYGGSITVYLPERAIISHLPKELKYT
jgi:hypothetical protein